MILQGRFKINKKGNVLSGKIISIKQVGGGIPINDEKNQALIKLQNLMKDNDLINKKIKLNNDGSFLFN